MAVRSVILLLVSVLAALFLVLNWSLVMAPMKVNLLYTDVDAPFGLILLVMTGIVWAVIFVWAIMHQASALLELRRAHKEAMASRGLADKAELSRIESTKKTLEEAVASMEVRLTEKQTADTRQQTEALNGAVAALQGAIEKLEGSEKANTEQLVTAQVSPVAEQVRGALETQKRMEAQIGSLQSEVAAVRAILERFAAASAAQPALTDDNGRQGFFCFLSGKDAAQQAQAPAPETTAEPAPAAEPVPAEAPAAETKPEKKGFFKSIFG